MNFEFTEEQKMLRQTVRSFVDKEIIPHIQKWDEEGQFDPIIYKRLAELGLMGVCIPEKYGGSGMDYNSLAIVCEELERGDTAFRTAVSVHTGLNSLTLLQWGTEEQKQKYLVPLAKGEKLGAFGLTEPNAGTDAAGQQTVAVLDGDHYVLNGSKIFITNGGQADTYVIFAMTDRTKGTRGISAFIVEADTPGFSIGKVEDKLGIRGSATTELIFQNCRIPKENLLGEEGKGFKIAMATLDGGRIGIAAQALGIAQGALDVTVEYLKERQQFGRPLSKFQGLQWMVADMETEINAARLLVYRAAFNKANGLPYNKEAAMAKLFAANTAMSVTTKCVQLHGGYGYTKDYPVERMMRDAKITEIYEGTSQVQQMVIAANLLR